MHALGRPLCRTKLWLPLGTLLFLCLVPQCLLASNTAYLGQTLAEKELNWLFLDYLPVYLNGRGEYDWRQADEWVKCARRNGMKIAARLRLVSRAFVTKEAYCAALAAAAGRYRGPGSQEMPGLRMEVKEWIADGTLYPEFVNPDDPASLAEFAIAAYDSLHAADAAATLIIEAGVCEPCPGPLPALNADYQKKFFVRLGNHFVSSRPPQLVFGFDLAATPGAYRWLGSLGNFWRNELQLNHLGGSQVRLMSVLLPKSSESEYASEIVKLHVSGFAAGLQNIFFLTPLPAEILNAERPSAADLIRRAQVSSFAGDSLHRASELIGGASGLQIREEMETDRCRVFFSSERNDVVVAWVDQGQLGSKNLIQVGGSSYVRVDRMMPDRRLVTTHPEITEGKIAIPASDYPAFIAFEKAGEDCHCHGQP